jgi:hypothetical protein
MTAVTNEGAAALWSRFARREPEQTASKPAIGQHQALGPFRDGQLIVAAHPARVDIVYAALPQLTSAAVPTLGDHLRVVDSFVHDAKTLVDAVPAVYRLALGCVLLQPAAGRVEGYRTLAPFLPKVQVDAEASSDFMYQINRPRPSKGAVPGLAVNRISKWSVQVTAAISFSPQLPGQVEFSPQLPGQVLQYAVRLETDVNSTREVNAELPRAVIPSLLDELAGLTLEIAAQGDVE